MGLRAQAEKDLKFILEDATYGFGWPITITNPSGESISLTGFSNDISQSIDPETGILVSGQSASCALRISTIYELGGCLVTECGEPLSLCGEPQMEAGNVKFGLPIGIADEDSNPWLATFADINGKSCTFKIQQTNPDRTLGIITCLLEDYAA